LRGVIGSHSLGSCKRGIRKINFSLRAGTRLAINE
jgi:hypothetical protein